MGSSEQPKSRTPPPMEVEAELSQSAGGVAHDPTALGSNGPPWIGRVLDERYEIQRLLGEGGMGAVFVAEQLTLHKPVALKVIRAELAGNGEVAARFAREAMATAQFEHPHVASAIDYGTLPEGGAYFVMQLVRGKPLSRLIARGKLPWRRACEIGAQVADALSAAKAAGIIHRDLKPDNVLVERREDGTDLVKVLDFGIAHVAPGAAAAPVIGAQADRQLTRVGTVMGTPGYMSPEQSVGDKVDHRTDLYALGVVLWECLSGQELWSGPDLTTVVTRQMTENVPRLRDMGIDPTIPAELDDILQRLTARVPAERPEHAGEARDILRRLAHSRVSAPVEIFSNVVSEIRPRVSQAVERYRAQPPRQKAVQAAVVGVAALGSLWLAWPTEAPAGKTGIKEVEKSVVEKLAGAAKQVVADAVPVKKVPTIPKALEADAKLLIEGETVRGRRGAGDRILAYRPRADVFPYLVTISEFETARGCKPRREAVAKMKEKPDSRYLPTLRRVARSSKTGCGFLSLEDCHSCIRGDIYDTLDVIERTTLGASSP